MQQLTKWEDPEGPKFELLRAAFRWLPTYMLDYREAMKIKPHALQAERSSDADALQQARPCNTSPPSRDIALGHVRTHLQYLAFAEPADDLRKAAVCNRQITVQLKHCMSSCGLVALFLDILPKLTYVPAPIVVDVMHSLSCNRLCCLSHGASQSQCKKK